MVLVIVHLIEGYIIQLGTEGRLVQLQLEDMLVGVREERSDILADYLPDGRPIPHRVRTETAAYQPGAVGRSAFAHVRC